jgi:membrane-bound metal-dependent hydrolase YbcI (DUF457 family)
MFIGHLAVALAARRAAPCVPLGLLVGATFGLDLIWPLFLIAGLEAVRIDPGNTAFTPLDFEHYPWSHSLVMAGAWAALAAGLAANRFGSRAAGALVGGVVVSHWLLDLVTHRPDLPVWPGGPRVGLGLWNSVPATLAVEGALFVPAIEWYRRACPPRDAIGRWAFWALVAFTGAIWISGPWSPPPPSARAVAVVALAGWLFPLWAAWIDRHRRAGQNRATGD